MRILQIIGLLFLAFSTVVLAEEKQEEQEQETSEVQPQERPRLFRQSDMHPYAHDWGYWGYPHHGFRHRYYNPFYAGAGYGYGFYHPYGRWSMRSHLYFDTMYGNIPEPGKSELTVSIGSDDYFGTSISTTDYLSKKHGILYNVSALWEQGETYWTNQDYDSFTIAPTFFWSNENTSVYVGFEYTKTNMEAMDMSPFTAEAKKQQSGDKTSRYLKNRGFMDGDFTKKSARIGVEHDVTDSFSIGLHFNATDFDKSRR